MKIGAVIAAAGMSSRMKSFKPMLPLGGSTIIKTTILTLQDAGVREIAVVTGNEAELLEKHLSDTGVTCVYNARYAETDMFASACLGLEYIEKKCGRTFFLPADLPLLSYKSLQIMLGFMDCSECGILIPAYRGKTGHPVLIENSAIPALTGYSEGGGLKEAIRSYTGSKLVIAIEDEGVTLDVDKPEDYLNLQEYVKSETVKNPLCGFVEVAIGRRYSFFDRELAGLLLLVDRYHSLSRASEELGMAYSKAWKRVKIAQNLLGFALLNCQTGGRAGGGSTLTDECRRFMRSYEEYSAQVERYAKDLFAGHFGKILDENTDVPTI